MNMKYIKFLPVAAMLLFGFSFARAQTTPGGVTNANLTWMAWLTPDTYNNGTWTNLITGLGTAGNFTNATTAPLKSNTSGYNFQPAILFNKTTVAVAPNQLYSQQVTINTTENVTMFFVFKQNVTSAASNLIGFSTLSAYNALYWNNANNTDLTFTWGNTTARTISAASEGILAIDNSNQTLAADGIRYYKNGALSTIPASTQWNGTTNRGTGAIALGGGANNQAWYGYQGNLQEVIIVKKSGNGHLDNTDLQKIQSYLATKYGITLSSGNYLNSAGTPVWDRSVNAPYDNNIFGIGRDDATLLNQVQSRSVGSDALTIYKGTLNALNNNSSNELTDKSFLMLGSNGLSGNTDYEYLAGTTFANGNLLDKINYRGNTIYKAQVTTGGVPGGAIQQVKMKVASTTAQYILVSNNPAFPTGNNTYIYPISALTAQNITINDGDFITVAGYEGLPGGLKSVTFSLWLTPDSYSNGVWTNRITNGVGNFTQPSNWTQKTPPAVTTGTNFHPAVQFRPNGLTVALNRMISENGINLTTNDAFSFILVYKANPNTGFANQNILNFYNAAQTGYIYNYALGYYTNNSNTLSAGWTTGTIRNLGAVPRDTTALVIVDNNNTGANGIRHYLNGAQIATATSQSGSVNNKIYLCGSNYAPTTTSGYGANADIQEVILLKRDKTATPFLVNNDLAKVQTYLAVKYGISMNTDYMATDGTVVWTNSANTGYNNNIFGIGRDDATGLYQKQSQSLKNKSLTVFVGNAVTTLNSQNTGTLLDRQYLMIGSDGGSVISQLNGVNAGDIYYGNNALVSSNGFNIQSNIYKAQVSGPSQSITVKMMAPSNDFIYALVSDNNTFTPNTTKIYAVDDRIVELEIDQTYKFIKFIGFAPGPGGVNPGLLLWLRADDDAAINIENLTSGDAKLNGYPSAEITDPNNMPGVSVWQDLVRNRTYSYAASNAANHYMPVYKPSSPQMNYHPAVRFWSTNTTGDNSYYSAWLTNPSGLMSTGNPPNGQHTAYMLVNNDFSNNDWFYAFAFSQNSTNRDIATGNLPQPGYGANRPNSTSTTGWFRPYPANPNSTNQNMFRPGATTMMGYHTKSIADNHAYYRFNAVESNSGTATFAWGDVRFNNPSVIGGAYASNRVIQGVISEIIFYDRVLDATETQKLESYLALKYGITLYPNNTYNRYSYTLSNTDVIWDGNQPAGNRYATFYNNVAAIVRDDAARLNNQQSHSTNVGSLLHLGVAGTMLSFDGSTTQLGELNDMEAVTFGSDGAIGNTHITSGEPCSPFTDRFNRKWLIHKTTENNRPITLIVGAQNNDNITIGQDDDTKNHYYNKLGTNFDVSLIVANSPDSINNGLYKAVIPMTYINGEHQCNYTFTDEDTYITFGWKANNKGCVGDADAAFTGTKTFSWTQWTATVNRSNNTGLSLSRGDVDLNDNIHVTGTSVSYPGTVRANIGYPRSGNIPARGSLEVQRRGGATNQDVVINITFNHPVIPEFSISGLDSYLRCYEEVEISGECANSPYSPVLSYASAQNRNTTYTITGNRATVNRRGFIAGNNNNGKVNVKFRGGVTSITIKYRTKGATTTATQQIYISPITLRSVPPPPPINSDGLSFVKQAKESNISTCEPVEYTFYIQNTNCDPVPVNFSDVLPEKMKWDAASIGLDAESSDLNESLDPQIIPAGSGNGETLQINGLIVPGVSTLILTATAVFDEDAPGGEYSNRASIVYDLIVNNNPVQQPPFYSRDRETLEPFTILYATEGQCAEKVEMNATYSRRTYGAESEIEVTYTLTNPNAELTDIFLNINFNEEFARIGNVVVTPENTPATMPVAVTPDPQDATSSLIIAGSVNGIDGFSLPTGVTVIKFTLKAPILANVRDGYDENNQLTGKKVDLDIVYNFSSTMDDPCLLRAIEGLQGNKLIPYSAGKQFIITNKHVSTKIFQ